MGKIGAVREVPVESLRPYERNARLHSEKQVEQIAESIREFGFLNPVLIDKDQNIIAGHGRIEAAKLLGMEKVPCLYVEGLTEAQQRAYILADNRLTELGGWDMEIVENELSFLKGAGFDIGLTGFDWDAATELDAIEEKADASDIMDAIEEKADASRTKPGDVWILGRHRLVCGDSASAADQKKLFQGKKASLVFTDPPYGVAIGDKNKMLDEVGGGEKWPS